MAFSSAEASLEVTFYTPPVVSAESPLTPPLACPLRALALPHAEFTPPSAAAPHTLPRIAQAVAAALRTAEHALLRSPAGGVAFKPTSGSLEEILASTHASAAVLPLLTALRTAGRAFCSPGDLSDALYVQCPLHAMALPLALTAPVVQAVLDSLAQATRAMDSLLALQPVHLAAERAAALVDNHLLHYRYHFSGAQEMLALGTYQPQRHGDDAMRPTLAQAVLQQRYVANINKADLAMTLAQLPMPPVALSTQLMAQYTADLHTKATLLVYDQPVFHHNLTATELPALQLHAANARALLTSLLHELQGSSADGSPATPLLARAGASTWCRRSRRPRRCRGPCR
jgi:hypothetical protein